MARFYGQVQGARGPASRLGHKDLEVVAASWGGAVRTTLFTRGKEDWAKVELIPWQGNGKNQLIGVFLLDGNEAPEVSSSQGDG